MQSEAGSLTSIYSTGQITSLGQDGVYLSSFPPSHSQSDANEPCGASVSVTTVWRTRKEGPRQWTRLWLLSVVQ